MIDRRTALLAPFAAPALLSVSARAQAPSWRPPGPVRIVINAAPGGTTDIMGRMLAQHLGTRWNIQVVADNRSGGGGTIGSAEAIRTAPDGTTLLSSNIGPNAIAYSLFRNLPYRPDSFAPVGNMIRGPNALLVHPSIPARTVPEFVAYLKANPGLPYGSSGVGQSPHLSGVWFTQLTGTEATHVPFRGAGPLMVDLIAGNVKFSFDNLTSSVQQIRSGQVRALGVTSADRNAQMPELPPIRETMPELAPYDVNTWFGIFAHANMPREAILAYNAEINYFLGLQETKTRFAQMGGVPMPGTPEDFGNFVRSEMEKWGGVIRREGLQMDVS
ncbi:tripartite tricarboxylate transporter substrate binding protein [Rhodovarius crocodyli]|uniref:Tripartite tricarboxylate transporter substrate binding protein n=1 Tax=Rhodovarius crocodyli TaxID=1979269 RepID=A0A437MCB1_9PROT|nr:tripartite tricarboxylate transporter substrate binding protein [Rhodovarius crocodyli]RVT95286.1 tripartite tricarboxylate transporter substrate binding protein [Rhodovarius crocodyli]